MGDLDLIEASTIKCKLQKAANAPTNNRQVPITKPFSARTYGRESTPDPIAAALNEKILPLMLPFSSFPNVLLKNGLLEEVPIAGERINPCLMLMSAVALSCVGESGEETSDI